MRFTKITAIYFSATGTTQKIINALVEATGIADKTTIRIHHPSNEVHTFSKDEIVVVGTPVFSGRIPKITAEALRSFRGDQTPAILVCLYGNRAFEDALLELSDVVTQQGFHVCAAAAFIGQHSIFPQVAAGRPNTSDLMLADSFGKEAVDAISAMQGERLQLPGSRPYRPIKSIPLRPKTKHRCNKCGACVRICPVGAISEGAPRKVSKEDCISCGSCIAACPQKAKYFGGVLHWLGRRKFIQTYMFPQEPVLYLKK